MYHGNSYARGIPADNSALYSMALFLIAATAIVMRVALPAPLIDLFTNYTADEGSIIEKIHPGTYAIAGVFAIVLATRRSLLDAWSYRAAKALVSFSAALILLMTYLVLSRRTGVAGYLIDSYFAAVLAGLTMLLLPPQMRVRIGNLVLIVLAISALLAIFEFWTHMRLLPYAYTGSVFRATGLAGHHLALGLFCATAIPFLAGSNWKPFAKFAAIAILFVGAAAANARIAMIFASVAVGFVVLSMPMHGQSDAQRMQLKTLAIIAGMIILIGGVTMLALSGFLERLSGGFSDSSSMARIEVYKLFSMTGWRDILFGADMGRIDKLAELRLGLKTIESSLVVAVYQFGAIAALLLIVGFPMTLLRLLAGATPTAWAGAAVFLGVALANNTLTTKTPVVVVIFVLLIAAQARPLPRTTDLG